VARSVRRLLTDLGYAVHTPAELFGSRESSLGATDQEWLKRVTGRGWAIIGRDVKIYERPWEMEAYRRARVQVFLLPGQALAAQLTHLIAVTPQGDRRSHLWPEGRDVVPDRIRARRV
jgi:hypothetical protein